MYQVKQATFDDYQDLLDIITESFINLDPFTNYLKVTKNELSCYIKPYIHASIEQQFAFIVKNDEGKCIAASIYHDALSDITWDQDKLSAKIQAAILFYKSQYSLIDEYLKNYQLKIFSGLILCAGYLAILPGYFGTHIPHQIDKIVWPLAKQRGFRFIMTEFTNPCSYHLYKRKLGDELKVLKVVPYKDYLDASQNHPFDNFNGEYILAVVNLF